MHACAPWHMCGGQESVLSFYHVGPREWTLVSVLAASTVDSLSHLSSTLLCSHAYISPCKSMEWSATFASHIIVRNEGILGRSDFNSI